MDQGTDTRPDTIPPVSGRTSRRKAEDITEARRLRDEILALVEKKPRTEADLIGRIMVTAVMSEPLGWLDDAEARREGFEDAHGFVAAFQEINGGKYDPDALVWRVAFKAGDRA